MSFRSRLGIAVVPLLVTAAWVAASAFGPSLESAGAVAGRTEVVYRPGERTAVVITVQNNGFVPLRIGSIELAEQPDWLTTDITYEALSYTDPGNTVGRIDRPSTPNGDPVEVPLRGDDATLLELELGLTFLEGACQQYAAGTGVTLTDLVIEERALGLTWTRQRSIQTLASGLSEGISVSFSDC